MNSAATRYSLEKSVTNLREIIAVFVEARKKMGEWRYRSTHESSAQTLATLRAGKARPLPSGSHRTYGRFGEEISCHCQESKNETSSFQPAVQVYYTDYVLQFHKHRTFRS